MARGPRIYTRAARYTLCCSVLQERTQSFFLSTKKHHSRVQISSTLRIPFAPKEFCFPPLPSAQPVAAGIVGDQRQGPPQRAALTMPSARRVEPAVRPASPGPALHRQVQAALTPPQTQHTPSHLLLTSYHTLPPALTQATPPPTGLRAASSEHLRPPALLSHLIRAQGT